MASDPVSIALPPPGAELDALLAALPDTPAVFLLRAANSRPYLSKTALLGRRVRRLLKSADRLRSALNLRGVVDTLEYWSTSSRLESATIFYEQAREFFPDTYIKLCNLKMPVFVRILTANPFPRTQVTTRLGGRGAAFGPFRTRANAEGFEKETLDLFQIRRCQEDLDPNPDHPGCIYGEMGQCMRPCQDVVGRDEYATEVDRLTEFLQTQGRSLSDTVERMRDRASADMEFEEASRQHKRLERIQGAWKLRDELATDGASMHGVAVVKARDPHTVLLLFLLDGAWQTPVPFAVEANAEKPVSMDRRLHEVVHALLPRTRTVQERQEHIALLARWYYSSWRDGEWLPFRTLQELPYRKLVNMIARVAG
ncbi:MAG: hypothetical protein FJW32_03425 [Acidobacteria bacterium]|nr:hypothetical protein [Acidobacteriota bacterium]